MHPEVEQDHPGNCPICGMALEPKTPVGTGEEENAELRDMTGRFWVGAALSLPVFVLGMAHLFPNAPTCAHLHHPRMDDDRGSSLPSPWLGFGKSSSRSVGIDSVIELFSASVLLWRLRIEASGSADDERVKAVEHQTMIRRMFAFFANILSPISSRTTKSCAIPSVLESVNWRWARQEICKFLSGPRHDQAGIEFTSGKPPGLALRSLRTCAAPLREKTI